MDDHNRQIELAARMLVDAVVAGCNADRLRDDAEYIQQMQESGDLQGVERIVNQEYDTSLIYEICEHRLRQACGWDITVSLPPTNTSQYVVDLRRQGTT